MSDAPLCPVGPGHQRRTRCRACDGGALQRVLELGPQPLANAFLDSPDAFAAERRYPLDLTLCGDCGLLQLCEVIDPELLFREYLYVSGTSRTMAEHFAAYADQVVQRIGPGPDRLVVELASNDGTLLRQFQRHGCRVLGVEPARNIAARAREAGIETREIFFGRDAGPELRREHGPAHAVLANNVLAHVDDPAGFLAGAAALLAPEGVLVVEVPYVIELLERLEYDTVYHEHLCYFAVRPLLRLCEAVGLSVLAAERIPVHGGSVRLTAGLRSRHPDHAAEVLALVEQETASELFRLERWERFAADVRATREALRGMLCRFRADGLRVAGYGAPAKGNTLLNYCDIGPELVRYTVDRNPLKVGRFTPGTHLPVRPYEGTLLEDRPDVVLILAWNFADEIMAQPQERRFRQEGGRFLLPLPMPRMV